MKLKKLFDQVYFNPVETNKDTSKGHRKKQDRIARFFGLRLPYGGLDSIGVLRALTGWEDADTDVVEQRSTSRKFLEALIILPVNLLLAIAKTALNTLKLVTEFLPLILMEGSKSVLEWVFKQLMDSDGNLTLNADDELLVKAGKIVKRLLAWLGVVLLSPVVVAFHVAYFIGCATTSPADNLRAAFNKGNALGGGIVGKVFGVIFALVSMLTTACVYAVLFPLALAQAPALLPEVAASVIPFLSTTLPAALTSFGTAIGAAIGPMIVPTFTVGLAASTAITVGGLLTPAVAAIDALGEKNAKISIEDKAEMDELDEEKPRNRLIELLPASLRDAAYNTFFGGRKENAVEKTNSLNNIEAVNSESDEEGSDGQPKKGPH